MSSQSLQTLFKKQKTAIRAIVFAKFNAHTNPIFKKTNVLTIHNINKLQTACFAYKAINKLLSLRFSTLYVTSSEIHCHNTRKKSNLIYKLPSFIYLDENDCSLRVCQLKRKQLYVKSIFINFVHYICVKSNYFKLFACSPLVQ